MIFIYSTTFQKIKIITQSLLKRDNIRLLLDNLCVKFNDVEQSLISRENVRFTSIHVFKLNGVERNIMIHIRKKKKKKNTIQIGMQIENHHHFQIDIPSVLPY